MTDTDPIAPHGGTLVDLLADADTGAALRPRPPTCPRSSWASASCPTWRCWPSVRSRPYRVPGRADYHAVLETMHLTNGLPWAIPVTLSLPTTRRTSSAAPTPWRWCPPRGRGAGRAPRSARSSSATRRRKPVASTAPRTPSTPASRRSTTPATTALAGTLEVIALPSHDDFRATASRPARDAGRVPRARVEDGRGVPDPQPDPPRARVHPEVRAGDRGRAAGAPAGGRHEGRRHARRRAHAVLRGAVRGLLPEGPRDGRRVPRRHALRRSPRGHLARDRAQELRLHALHRGPRPRRRRELLRHLRRAADLRPSSRRASWASPR